MHFYPYERLALFIDGPSLSATAGAIGVQIDYSRILDFFRQHSRLVGASYYIDLTEGEAPSSGRSLLDWLAYNGYTVRAKVAKERTVPSTHRNERASTALELAVDAMRYADTLDHFVIFSGNGNLRALVSALQQDGKRISIISTLRTRPPIVADELRRQSDQFIDLWDLVPFFGRKTTDSRNRNTDSLKDDRGQAPARANPSNENARIRSSVIAAGFRDQHKERS